MRKRFVSSGWIVTAAFMTLGPPSRVSVTSSRLNVASFTARENVKNSKGMLTFYAPEPVAAAAPAPRRLEDMDMDELKLSMLSLGIKTQKKMKRDDVIRLIRDRMSEVEIVDDEDDGAE
mgnify:CR=1 FL=1